MRYDKILPREMPMSEWKKMVLLHYSDEHQTNRIEETVKFIVGHCSSVAKEGERKISRFKGVWDYLDIHDEKMRDFKKALRSALAVHFSKLQIRYDIIPNEDDDIVVEWGDYSDKI